MTRRRAPIVVFAYRRERHLRAMLASLAQCHGFADSEVFVYIDGPKGADDRADVQAVRDLVAGLPHRNVRAVVRERNLGLRRSVFAGVGEVVACHGRAIVLEDDFILSRHLLEYFDTALEAYAGDERVWSVCAYMYDVPALRARRRAFVLPFAHPWGWATWGRAWTRFTLDAPIDRAELRSAVWRQRFNLHGLRNFAAMLEASLDGRIDSWYIQWYYRLFREGGVSIFPPVSYVLNDGLRGTGATHSSALNPYHLLVRRRPIAGAAVPMPEHLEIDCGAIDAIVGSWDAKVQRTISGLGRLRRLAG